MIIMRVGTVRAAKNVIRKPYKSFIGDQPSAVSKAKAAPVERISQTFSIDGSIHHQVSQYLAAFAGKGPKGCGRKSMIVNFSLGKKC